MDKCKFDDEWRGRCDEPADSTGFCRKHWGVLCRLCGVQAITECGQTVFGLTCGVPLCGAHNGDCKQDHGRWPILSRWPSRL